MVQVSINRTLAGDYNASMTGCGMRKDFFFIYYYLKQYMQQEEFEQETLLKQQATKLTEERSRDPLPLRRPRRPYKGIFLAFFLWFTGMMFFVHGFHKYEDYSWFDLISVWLLSILLMIPGSYFAAIIFAVQVGTSGFSYKNYRQLYF